MIGTKAGPYVLTRRLGEGGMGAVYLAEHERLHILKAVKVLLPEFSNNPTIVKRFENEAMAAARLKHRNIIGVDDFGQLADGQWFIAMPFLEGASLERLLVDRGRLTIHQTLHLIAQVCAALQAAHDEGIVHRDLKPANVFVSQTPTNPYHVTLLDFGIAKLRGDGQGGQTLTGMVIGTPLYMAAELLEDSSRADARSDVFSLGVMTYQLVSADLPFGAFTAPILYNRQLTDRPTPPAHVPQEWATAIMSALALSPADRPASARAFALALASATPADPPYEPSGAEIVTAVAPELLSTGAYEATVKNTSDAGRIAVLLWPRPDTPPVPRPSPAVALADARTPPVTAGTRTVGLGGAQTPMMHAPVVSPPPAIVPATPTTLSAASGPIATSPSRDDSRRFRPLLIGLGLIAVGLVIAIIVVTTGRGRGQDAGASVGVDAGTIAHAAGVDADGLTDSPVASELDASAARDVAATTSAEKSATILIETSPAGAAVIVDGRELGKSPQQIERPVGSRLSIRTELVGYRTATKSHVVAAGADRIGLRLVRQRGPKPSSGSAGGFDPDDVGGD